MRGPIGLFTSSFGQVSEFSGGGRGIKTFIHPSNSRPSDKDTRHCPGTQQGGCPDSSAAEVTALQ